MIDGKGISKELKTPRTPVKLYPIFIKLKTYHSKQEQMFHPPGSIFCQRRHSRVNKSRTVGNHESQSRVST